MWELLVAQDERTQRNVGTAGRLQKEDPMKSGSSWWPNARESSGMWEQLVAQNERIQ
jgi:hypothetical protein